MTDIQLERAAVVTVPILLSLQSAAAILDCSATTVRRRINDGQLQGVLMDGRLKVRGDHLLAYIEGLPSTGSPVPARRRQQPDSPFGKLAA